MIRVAMVNTARTQGGAARVAALLTQTFYDRFDDVEAALYHCEDREQKPPFFGLKHLLSRPLNAILARLGGSTWVCDMGLAQTLIEKNRDADLLHIHNLHGYYLDYWRLLQAWQDRPVVWTLHDMWGLTGRCGFPMACQEWRRGCKRCRHKDYYPRAWFDRARHEFNAKSALFFGLNRLAIISPSQWLAGLAVERGFPPDSVHVIPNPLDIDRLEVIDKITARKRLNLPENAFIALFVAADCADGRKGYRDFAYAVQAAECVGIAVGKPPRNPEPTIRHTGPIDARAVLTRYYCAADVYIIPSYADNYPNTVIEALACGTPVIGYDEGGIPAQLDNPYCSIVPKNDKGKMADLLSLYSHRQKKSPLIEKRLAFSANTQWNPYSIAQTHMNLYKKLIYG